MSINNTHNSDTELPKQKLIKGLTPKEYQTQYSRKKRLNKIRCESCNKEYPISCMKQHKKSYKHDRNSRLRFLSQNKDAFYAVKSNNAC